jgi:galactonate dehydratase
VGCNTPEEYAAAARRTVALGFRAMKFDPFRDPPGFETGITRRPYTTGMLPLQSEDEGIDRVAAVRQAVGPQIELLIDAHGRYNVPAAVRIGRKLEPLKITWFEEPVPPESPQALRAVREQVGVPISVGERLYTRFDFVPIFEQRLADYIMPDILWTGGISELMRIAAMAEAYYIPVSPHNVMGPIQLVAGAHAMTAIPNFYRHEHAIGAVGNYQQLLRPPIDFRGGEVYVSDRPGLGHELDMAFARAHEVTG